MSRNWLAAYTRSGHETSVGAQLRQKDLTFLLPLYQKFSRWSDRVKRIQTPLFPGYVFVNVDDHERIRVLQTPGVVNIVSVAGKPSKLSAQDIEVLRTCVVRPCDVQPHPYLKVGRRVRVRNGPFSGCEGILVEKKNSARVIVAVEHIMEAVAINIHLADIEAIA
jgi:transcription antitermination factor NusG